MRRSLGLFGAFATIALLAAPAVATTQVGPAIEAPRLPKKQIKAVKRQKFAEAYGPPRYRRSKNPPTKRQLKSNMRHVSKRVRRKHRRAAR